MNENYNKHNNKIIKVIITLLHWKTTSGTTATQQDNIRMHYMRLWGVGYGHSPSKWISFWFIKITLELYDLFRRYCDFSCIHIVSRLAFIINDGEFLCCIIWWSGLLSDLLKALIEDRDFVPVCLSQHVRLLESVSPSVSMHICCWLLPSFAS